MGARVEVDFGLISIVFSCRSGFLMSLIRHATSASTALWP